MCTDNLNPLEISKVEIYRNNILFCIQESNLQRIQYFSIYNKPLHDRYTGGTDRILKNKQPSLS